MVKLFTRKLDNKKDAILILAFSFAIVFLLNLLSSYVSLRVDMTAEKKYSLLKPTKTLIKELKDVVIIKVYLQGNMSSDFKRLQQATKDILTEMRAIGGKKIEYEFIDPITGKSVDEQNAMMQEFLNKGLSPVNEQTGKANESKLTRVFPFAIAVYGGREFPIQLIQSQIGFDKKQTINNSIISLEYNFANAIQKLTQYRPPRVAFTTGHGELSSLELADIQMQLSTLQYQIQTIDLSKTYKVPELFDAIVIAKPLYPFSEVDKYKIDQYVMRGGKVLWLIDPTYAEMDV